MPTIVGEAGEFTLPDWVVDIDSYRRWTDAPDYPEFGRIWWLGKVWADMSREQIFTHLGVKNEYAVVLTGLARTENKGLFIPDGMLLSNFAADISGKPDGTFVSYQTLASDRVRLIEGAEGGYNELQGAPDMVLEVVSRSSVHKDTVVMREAYWNADIPEYWLVDARKEPIVFDILRHTARGYVAARKRDGWIKSGVFSKEFRFRQTTSRLGHPQYHLDVR